MVYNYKTDDTTVDLPPAVTSKLDLAEFEARLFTIIYVRLVTVQPTLHKVRCYKVTDLKFSLLHI